MKKLIIAGSVVSALAVIGALSAHSSVSVASPGTTTGVQPTSAASVPTQAASNLSKANQAIACMGGSDITQITLSDAMIATANVYTSIPGSIMTGASSQGQLVLARFNRCVQSLNGSGYVTIYSASGDLLANGSF